MTGRLGLRLERLEARSGGAWRSWVGTPLREWPDAALVAYLCDRMGMPLPPSEAAAATWLTDAQLVAIVAAADVVAVVA